MASNASKSKLNSLIDFINNEYVDDVNTDSIVNLTVDNILAKLDPHSVYMDEKLYNEFKVETSGAFGGVGIVVGMKDKHLIVVSPIEGTPGEKAGIKSGDRIVRIDGAETKNQLWIQDRSDFKKDFTFAKAVYQCDDPDQVDRLWNRLPDWFFQSYAVVRSWPEVVEVGSLAASKGYAVSELASRLGLSNSEVMIFGDQGNDRSMFEIPDFKRVAMGNAIDEIKDLADYVTDTNERDGIAKALRKLVL